MTKKEIQQALDFVRGKVVELKDWLIKHHTNPFINTVAKDIRHFENQISELVALDLETYPTLEEVKAMQGKELLLVMRTLPKPRNENEQITFDYIFERIKQYSL